MILAMKSLRKSYGKKYRPLVLSLGRGLGACLSAWFFIWVMGCSSAPSDQKQVEPEVSLKADRSSVEELRKDIPPEKRKANDELRVILQLFVEAKESPERIREKYNQLNQREREKFRRESQHARDLFNRQEKKNRDAFNSEMKNERESLTAKKISGDERKHFFDDLEEKRRDFNNDERTKRDDFNTDMRQKNDDFNALMRDRDQDFNEKYRAYSVRYSEIQNAKREHSPLAPPPLAPTSRGVQPPGAKPEPGNPLFSPDTEQGDQ